MWKSKSSQVTLAGGWQRNIILISIMIGLCLAYVMACSRGDTFPAIPTSTPDLRATNWVRTPLYTISNSREAPDTPEGWFLAGFLDAGGREDWGRHMVSKVVPLCENKDYGWVYQPGYYLSVAQFNPGSWVTVSSITGRYDSLNLYHVGYNSARWIQLIAQEGRGPGSRAGWPLCW